MAGSGGCVLEKLLEVENLRTEFVTAAGSVAAVDGVSLYVQPGETLAVVGESGCGKSVTALSIMRLVPSPPGRITGGRIVFGGRDLLSLTEAEMRDIRGNEIAMIFQEPMTALNPVFTVGQQISEAIRLHQGLGARAAAARTAEIMRLVGIPEPERRMHQYPHEMSGGLRQRVMIAMALSCRPKLLIADEPTTALDVTIQAQILDLMRRLKEELGMAIMLITHDLAVVAEMAQRVMVMYAGRVVEQAPVEELFSAPAHPYTRGLLASIPTLDTQPGRLHVIEGTVPALHDMPAGCRFHPRCPLATDLCRRQAPPLVERTPGHQVACWHENAAEEVA